MSRIVEVVVKYLSSSSYGVEGRKCTISSTYIHESFARRAHHKSQTSLHSRIPSMIDNGHKPMSMYCVHLVKTMIWKFEALILPTLALLWRQVPAFSVLPVRYQHSSSISDQRWRSRRFPTFAETQNPVDELSEERRANLFQFLLRDLEVEGVPLLGCDADQANTAQATIWTVMAQLSENDEGSKACMVLENMPVESLRNFVEDFETLKADDRVVESLFELKRFNVTLVGRGVGPAILVETANRTDAEEEEYKSLSSFPVPNEITWTAAIKSFVARMKLEKEGVVQVPMAYRLAGSNDVCDVLATFWTCVCEMLSQPEEALGSTLLCLPSVTEYVDSSEAHNRFCAVSNMVSRSLLMSRGEDRVELTYMHPQYDRDAIHPNDGIVFGHLPPIRSIRAMLEEAGRQSEAENLTAKQIALQNFQRRSPLPAIVIRRRRTDDASDKQRYVTAALRLVGEGEESLQAALASEIELTK